jgi:hypothetical protein
MNSVWRDRSVRKQKRDGFDRSTADGEMQCSGAKIGFRFTRRTTFIGNTSEKWMDESRVAYD